MVRWLRLFLLYHFRRERYIDILLGCLSTMAWKIVEDSLSSKVPGQLEWGKTFRATCSLGKVDVRYGMSCSAGGGIPLERYDLRVNAMRIMYCWRVGDEGWSGDRRAQKIFEQAGHNQLVDVT